MSKGQNKLQWSCNCRIKGSCPLNGKYLHQCMVYEAEIATNITYRKYYEMSEGELKSRYNNQGQSFRHISHNNDAELSKYFWLLKANGTDFLLKWSINSYKS